MAPRKKQMPIPVETPDIDLLADAQHEADLATNSGSDKLDKLKELARKQIDLEDEIAALEAQVSARKAELQALSSKDLPLAFGALNLSSITVGNTEVTVESGVDARMPNAVKDPAGRRWVMDWLVANKHEGVIKVFLEVQFGKGDFKLANTIAKYLKEKYKLPALVEESVHAGTYKSLIKGLLKEKKIIPEEDLGVFRYVYTVVNRPEM